MFNHNAPDRITACGQGTTHGNFRVRVKSGHPGTGENLLRWACSKLRTHRSA
ncbi:hypothetical protein OHB33_40600 (plasmid) [Streptomyces sp. NBC_01558]|uniref:hypothetical protein n=1 Tax=Streptomyces sp. NBC_01558 TaxID=2975878 RepID=UPI002DD8E083|nr:hypothetical protein [Streptomyces sp. NBC_01558]WSD74823.1 hypothetical protein OHB33_00025 [Streptomyces sp. NBC_01558]WSD82692.1 hypothetical protein OHB33_40600 [Streptomyces sp. NBC_01558]